MEDSLAGSESYPSLTLSQRYYPRSTQNFDTFGHDGRY